MYDEIVAPRRPYRGEEGCSEGIVVNVDWSRRRSLRLKTCSLKLLHEYRITRLCEHYTIFLLGGREGRNVLLRNIFVVFTVHTKYIHYA